MKIDGLLGSPAHYIAYPACAAVYSIDGIGTRERSYMAYIDYIAILV
jgi:hypothetical protein